MIAFAYTWFGILVISVKELSMKDGVSRKAYKFIFVCYTLFSTIVDILKLFILTVSKDFLVCLNRKLKTLQYLKGIYFPENHNYFSQVYKN